MIDALTVFADVDDQTKLVTQSLPGAVMTSSLPLAHRESNGRLASLLRLALRLSGSSRALAVQADGTVLIDLGGGLDGVSQGELARLVLAQARQARSLPPGPKTIAANAVRRGAPFLASAPIIDATGAFLGVLAVAGGRAPSRPEQLHVDLS